MPRDTWPAQTRLGDLGEGEGGSGGSCERNGDEYDENALYGILKDLMLQ